MIRLSHIGLPLIGGVLVSFYLIACGSDDPAPADGTGGSSGSTGGSSGSTGGAKPSTGGGGSTSTGGASTGTGGGSTEDLYVCENAPPRDPGGTGAEGSECCTTSIGKVGKCVKESSISDATQKAAFGYDSCKKADSLKCSPDPAQLATAEQNGVYAECTATLGEGEGLEGRCLPKCFVAGVGAAAQLKQDGCQTADLVCAPCYNPIDGADTGACKQKSGDAPKKAAPTPYKKCGGDLGICVPASLVTDAAQKAALQKAFEGASSGCDGTDLCAPVLKAKDQAACFKKCDSIAALPGACVPEYIVPAAQRDLIRAATGCGTGELCAPCQDPTSMPMPNMATGACN